MSGNASRKYKQYMLMQERRKLFGDIEARTEEGILDLVAYGAAKGRVITSRSKYSLDRVPKNKRKGIESTLKRSAILLPKIKEES